MRKTTPNALFWKAFALPCFTIFLYCTTAFCRQQQSGVSLKSLLTELRDHYKVDILFSDKLVETFTDVTTKPDYKFSLETNLTTLLKPLGLRFRKAQNGSYLITKVPLPNEQQSPDKAGANNPPEVLVPEPVKKITGIVRSDSGDVLSGVTVSVLNGSKSVVTNAEGKYTIQVPNNANTLVFSYVGYGTKEINIGNNRTLNIALARTDETVQDVVVVGYGVQRKVNLTGSVASLNFKDVQNVPQANTLNILQGRLPGVSLIQPGGQPGDDQPEVLVRGIGTLNYAAPLVIIDGAQSTLSDLGALSPAEISNVSVLKDAASAAIYGSRGANGVILVTTKEPGKERVRINFNAYTGRQYATYIPRFVESWQWMVLQNEATNSTLYPLDMIQQVQEGRYTDSLGNTQWMEELYKPAPISSYTLSLNGGSQAISFQGSMGYIKQDGLINNTSSGRYNFRTNVRATLSKKLEAGLNIYGYLRNSYQPFDGSTSASSTNTSPTGALITGGNNTTINNIINAANQAFPYVPVKTSNGNWGVYAYANGTSILNPILMTEIGNENYESLRANAQTFLSYKPIKGLVLKTTFNYQYGNDYKDRYNPTYSYPNLQGTGTYVNNRSQVQNLEAQDKQLQWQTTAVYNTRFAKKHAFNFLLGHELVEFKNRQFSATGFNTPNNGLQVLGSAVSDYTVSGVKQGWSLQSFFGRINYIFNDRYLLEGNLRADGSSRFPDTDKYGYFPSVSAGWIVSKENFFKGLGKTFSLFKLRASWGQTGNDQIGNYSYIQYVNLNNLYPIGGSLQAAGSYTGFANPNLKWETTSSKNLGLDLGLLNGALQATVDVYDRATDDILFKTPLPASYGTIDPPVRNIGSVSNRGWEASIDYRSKATAKFFYRIGVNASYVKNKITKLNGQESVYGSSNGVARLILREGQDINSYYGYEFIGLYRSADDYAKYPAYSTSGLELGTSILKDQNGDGKVNADDRIILGSANTPFTYGITGGISYAGFDMNFLLQGVSGKKIFINDNGNRPANTNATNFWKEWWDNRFDTAANPNGTWPVLKRTAPEVGQVTNSFFLRNASYLRLKNIEIGYTFSRKILGRLKISNLRIYASGQNLLTFSQLIKQIDPERSSVSVANTTYPQTKVITAGVNLNF